MANLAGTPPVLDLSAYPHDERERRTTEALQQRAVTEGVCGVFISTKTVLFSWDGQCFVASRLCTYRAQKFARRGSGLVSRQPYLATVCGFEISQLARSFLP